MIPAKKWTPALVLLILTLAAPGCALLGRDESPRPAPQRQAKKKREKPALPPAFQDMEDAALGLYNFPGDDWNQAAQELNELNGHWRKVVAQLEREKVPADQRKVVEMHLAGLEAAVENQNLFKVREHANEVTGALPDLTSKFKTVIPADLVKMAAGLREISLHVAAANWQTAGDLTKEAPKSWQRLKNQGEQVGAKEVGKNLESSFKELEEAIKAKDKPKAEQAIAMIRADLADLRRAFSQNNSG